MFCARAGAAEVVGVDRSEVIYDAMDIVRENGLSDVVKLVKGRLEEMVLPGGRDRRFDVIVSEWMGYFLLFEGMLDSVLYARDHLLADGGTLMPNRCTMSLVAVSDMERYDHLLSFWSDVYGFRMSCLRAEVLQGGQCGGGAGCRHLLRPLPDQAARPQHDHCGRHRVHGAVLGACDARVPRNGAGRLLFDTHFDLPIAVGFSTGPQAPSTHWKQTVFYLEQPVSADAGDTIDGTLFCGRDRKDPRSLRVTLTTGGRSQSYRVS
ncbi:protein arginine N-methyltransferase 3-like [Pollicipes pollicipes]|uniref:protein arginine N-methyltransferase 3-like n=1 Tax=Pollicipes pollicipes TaxID=41117 RepID=UPI001885019A|nr:protein arginine N-methyltransferase 3-like [Pollicipes pollicipes]